MLVLQAPRLRRVRSSFRDAMERGDAGTPSIPPSKGCSMLVPSDLFSPGSSVESDDGTLDGNVVFFFALLRCFFYHNNRYYSSIFFRVGPSKNR